MVKKGAIVTTEKLKSLSYNIKCKNRFISPFIKIHFRFALAFQKKHQHLMVGLLIAYTTASDCDYTESHVKII